MAGFLRGRRCAVLVGVAVLVGKSVAAIIVAALYTKVEQLRGRWHGFEETLSAAGCFAYRLGLFQRFQHERVRRWVWSSKVSACAHEPYALRNALMRLPR